MRTTTPKKMYMHCVRNIPCKMRIVACRKRIVTSEKRNVAFENRIVEYKKYMYMCNIATWVKCAMQETAQHANNVALRNRARSVIDIFVCLFACLFVCLSSIWLLSPLPVPGPKIKYCLFPLSHRPTEIPAIQ
jgi:hypothetical protein